MCNGNGWIKIHRKMIEWEWFSCPATAHLFLYLILTANTEDKNWRGTIVKRGQTVVTRRKICAICGISEREFRTALKRLKASHCVTSLETRSYTLVTICNYESYQQSDYLPNSTSDPQSDPQATHKRPTKDPQRTLTKEYKNKRIKEDISHVSPYVDTCVSDSSSSDPPSARESTEIRFSFEGFAKFFNDELSKANSVIPRIKQISGARRQHVTARLREFSKADLAEVVRKAARSDFLNGKNSRAFIADFNWIFRPNNFPKILEGNYDNERISTNHLGHHAADGNSRTYAPNAYGSTKAEFNAEALRRAEAAVLRVVQGMDEPQPDF